MARENRGVAASQARRLLQKNSNIYQKPRSRRPPCQITDGVPVIDPPITLADDLAATASAGSALKLGENIRRGVSIRVRNAPCPHDPGVSRYGSCPICCCIFFRSFSKYISARRWRKCRRSTTRWARR